MNTEVVVLVVAAAAVAIIAFNLISIKCSVRKVEQQLRHHSKLFDDDIRTYPTKLKQNLKADIDKAEERVSMEVKTHVHDLQSRLDNLERREKS